MFANIGCMELFYTNVSGVAVGQAGCLTVVGSCRQGLCAKAQSMAGAAATNRRKEIGRLSHSLV